MTESQLLDRVPSRIASSVVTVAELRGSIDFLTLDGPDIKAIRAAVPGVTVNDIFLTVVAGALDAYLSEKGEKSASGLAAMVPRSIICVE